MLLLFSIREAQWLPVLKRAVHFRASDHKAVLKHTKGVLLL